MKILVVLATLALASSPAFAQEGIAKAKDKSQKVATPPPMHPPLQSVDVTKLPEGAGELDLFLLTGQSNMKGRGVMPDKPKLNPHIVMMHLKDDSWYLARHPLHLSGDAKTFAGHDNAGVGPGLSFAATLTAQNPKLAVGLIPCAIGGTSIQVWQKGAKLNDEAVRRAKLALQTTAPVKARIRAVLWLQGEADANPRGLAVYEAKLLKLVDDLRADLGQPELPFIACTIGEMGDAATLGDKAALNKILLDLPAKRPHTACVDARDIKTNIGDNVHFDTAAQDEIGKRFAAKYAELTK